jgi:hypothetical protein
MQRKIIRFPEYHGLLLMHPYEHMHQGTALSYLFRGIRNGHIHDVHTAIQICPRIDGELLRFQVIKHIRVEVIRGQPVWTRDRDFENSDLCKHLFGHYSSIEYAFDGEYVYVEIHDESEQIQFLLSNTNYETNY